MIRVAALVGALTLLIAAGPAAAPASADTGGLSGYATTASASVLQITEDYPSASAHPLVEVDAVYTTASLDASRAHALSAGLWPGSLGANLGSLVAVLGGPAIEALNYPVKAEAPTKSGAPESNLAAGSLVMNASTKSAGLNQQTAESSVTAASVDVGTVTFDSPSSHSVANVDTGTGTDSDTATSAATNIDIAGVITVGAIRTTVSAKSVNGGAPVVDGTTTYQDLKIAGQAAYVDSTGIHLGSPGKPAGSGALDVVNKVVNAIGMQIFFTSAKTVKLGAGSYFYPASILILFTPPGDSNHDSMTIALGDAAASMLVASAPGEAPPSSGASDQSSVLPPPSTATATLEFPSSTPSGGTPPLALGAAPSSSSSSSGPSTPLGSGSQPAQLAVAAPHGIGYGWILLLLLVGLVGAALLPRVPALLRAAAGPCEQENPWIDSPDRRS